MDNDIKLSKEQLKNLIDEFKAADKSDSVSTDAFLKKHLSDSQAKAIKNVLSNPELLKNILNSQKAKDIMEKLKGENKNES